VSSCKFGRIYTSHNKNKTRAKHNGNAHDPDAHGGSQFNEAQKRISSNLSEL